MVPFGAGTSLEGNVVPVAGGISLDLGQMNRILRVSAEDLDATVEAGVTRQQLNRSLADDGAAVLYRSGVGMHAGRDGGDARLGHDGGEVRDDAGERARR